MTIPILILSFLLKRNWTAIPCFILTLRQKNAMRLAHSFRRDYTDQNALRASPLLLSAPGLPLVCHGQLRRRSRRGGFRLTAVSSVFETTGRTVRPNGQNLRLPLQAVANRRQRGRQDMSAVQIQRGLLQHHLHIYNRWETRRRP